MPANIRGVSCVRISDWEEEAMLSAGDSGFKIEEPVDR